MNKLEATFIGQTKSHVVRGKLHYKIRNTFSPSLEVPCSQDFFDSFCGGFERTQLEQLYFEFCKKAYNMMITKFGGEQHARQITFPDFTFDVITNDIDIPIK